MQFALVENERTAPSAGLKGICPACSSPMIARCGSRRVHHWAHRGERNCDSWWEPETPWHRTWKNLFPKNWQEVILHDPNGEKHIADVRTQHGLTIEFQHSHLRPEERAARERSYGNLLWIVDGSRLVRDLPRFVDGVRSFRALLGGKREWYVAPFPDEVFPRNWLDSSVPVLFDFGSVLDGTEETARFTQPLWCLLPGRASGQAVVVSLSRSDFVHLAHSMAHPIQPQGIMEHVAAVLAKQRRRARDADLHAVMLMQQRHGWRRRRYARF